jgi:fluoride ion exporter CrcB/FEX
MSSFIKELWAFLKSRKKLWLLPLIMVMVILGGLLILAQGSVIAPFIYTLF